jgi:uncharacterized membrane protein
MSELIVAGFNDGHTAYLVRGALARMQDEIQIEGHGVAVVHRLEAGTVAIREAIDLSSEGELNQAFWKTLMGLVFSSSGTDKARDVPERLAAIGIDATFLANISWRVRPGTLAVAVIAGEAARDRVIGILQGFRAEITRTRLIGDDRKQWMDRLSGD